MNENTHILHLPQVDRVENFPITFILTYDLDLCDLDLVK